jgi:hypothetical protein
MPNNYGKKIERMDQKRKQSSGLKGEMKRMKPKPKGPNVKGPQPGGPGYVRKGPKTVGSDEPARRPMTRPKPVRGVIKPRPVKKRAPVRKRGR